MCAFSGRFELPGGVIMTLVFDDIEELRDAERVVQGVIARETAIRVQGFREDCRRWRADLGRRTMLTEG